MSSLLRLPSLLRVPSLLDLNDGCIRTIMFCLSMPDASRLSSTCSSVRAQLDRPTLEALVKMSILTSIATRLFSSSLSDRALRDIYSAFALIEVPSPRVPSLSDFACRSLASRCRGSSARPTRMALTVWSSPSLTTSWRS